MDYHVFSVTKDCDVFMMVIQGDRDIIHRSLYEWFSRVEYVRSIRPDDEETSRYKGHREFHGAVIKGCWWTKSVACRKWAV